MAILLGKETITKSKPIINNRITFPFTVTRFLLTVPSFASSFRLTSPKMFLSKSLKLFARTSQQSTIPTTMLFLTLLVPSQITRRLTSTEFTTFCLTNTKTTGMSKKPSLQSVM